MSARDIEIAEGLFIQENLAEGKVDAMYLTALQHLQKWRIEIDRQRTRESLQVSFNTSDNSLINKKLSS